MISRLTGLLVEKQLPKILLDIHGLGYELEVSVPTFYMLPSLGETVQLHTHLIVREDAHLLYGFVEESERAVFRQLIKVSGIGSKTALGILSALGTDDLVHAVNNEDIKSLSAAPGIGKKTAERLILELRGKLSVAITGHTEISLQQAVSGDNGEIMSALLALGYTEREAKAAVKGIAIGTNISEGVRLALKKMLK